MEFAVPASFRALLHRFRLLTSCWRFGKACREMVTMESTSCSDQAGLRLALTGRLLPPLPLLPLWCSVAMISLCCGTCVNAPVLFQIQFQTWATLKHMYHSYHSRVRQLNQHRKAWSASCGQKPATLHSGQLCYQLPWLCNIRTGAFVTCDMSPLFPCSQGTSAMQEDGGCPRPDMRGGCFGRKNALHRKQRLSSYLLLFMKLL